MKSISSKTASQELFHLLEKKEFKPTIPIDQQVANHLRQLILKEKIPAHTRLPAIRALAKLWDTNYHTVHDALSRLMGEGLIVLRPVRGSFVAPPRRALRRACLYHNHQLRSLVSSEDFYAHLNINLYSLLSKRGTAIVPFYDHRPFEKLHTIPPEIRKMAGDGDIDAVIATDIYPSHTNWLFSLEVPVASLMLPQPNRRVEVDIEQLVNQVIDLAVKSNRKTIGLIHMLISSHVRGRKVDVLRMELEKRAAQHGISVILPEVLESYAGMHWEQLSCNLCEQLLKSATPPDMLFVYPDSYMRGVATALVKLHIPVPEQILVVSHRNAENAIYIPFPMVWLTVKIEDFALALLEQLDRQILGEELTPTTMSLEVEETAPQRG